MRKSNVLSNAEANERRMLSRIHVAELVQVTAVHNESLTVDVKPLVKREMGGTYVPPPPILNVKIAYIPQLVSVQVTVDGKTGTGMGTMTPDIRVGDIGVIIYLDRDSDASQLSGEASEPNSIRLHSGDDAVFVGVFFPG